MIKKVNIILGAVFACLLVLKFATGARDMLKESSSRRAASNVASVRPVHVYYTYWAYYSVVDPISNRNGILLDIVRTIFPQAEFRRVYGDTEDFRAALEADPYGVAVGFGAHPNLESSKVCEDAPTPMAEYTTVFMTQRSNPWMYEDEDSLSGVRVVSTEDFLDVPQVRALKERYGDNVKVVPDGTTRAEMADMVESGEVAAFVATGIKVHGKLTGALNSVKIMQDFRTAGAIGSAKLLLHVSKSNPEIASKTIEEYEEGMKRIKKNGELGRILDYYGMQTTY